IIFVCALGNQNGFGGAPLCVRLNGAGSSLTGSNLRQTLARAYDLHPDPVFRLSIKLDVPRTVQHLRASLKLPRPVSLALRIAVIAEGDEALDAKKAGATFVGGESLIQQVRWRDRLSSCWITPDPPNAQRTIYLDVLARRLCRLSAHRLFAANLISTGYSARPICSRKSRPAWLGFSGR
ncbi:MAG: hypothetical protein BJ554DRAFT_4266, partial [Olpidium bornovanus]